MKILALEKEKTGIKLQQFSPHLRDEALKVWKLFKEGVIREIYFRDDKNEAVIILECKNVSEAKKILSTLPLVKKGLIDFEIIPLKTYTGFERLFQ